MTRSTAEHDLELVTARWQRRYADQLFRFALFSEFSVGEMLPGTIVHDRLTLAIALQRVVHAVRGDARRVNRWLSRLIAWRPWL